MSCPYRSTCNDKHAGEWDWCYQVSGLYILCKKYKKRRKKNDIYIPGTWQLKSGKPLGDWT